MKQSPPDGGTGADNPLLELSQSCTDIFNSWCKLWQSMLPGNSNTLMETGLRRMMDPSSWLSTGWNEFDRQLEHLIDRPVFADVWEIDREALKALTIWLELRQVGTEHQLLVWNTWMQAYLRFLGMLAEWGTQGKMDPSWQELISLWTDTANRTLMEAHRSEEFLDVQRRMLNSSLRYRVQEREVVEKISSHLQVPTRSELDEVHRSIHDLKRELRKLKRSVAQSKPQPKAAKEAATKSAPDNAHARPDGSREPSREELSTTER
jgi:class III poly(R)-hydroxyalkanoic acid synthase PhaE subunit